ncbi:Hypothetical predicted protein [Marmota monax]|uniref:Uncharacterized protein n=1 Tax=Marmota monax TaxID=9995 RepID=A0A5E4ARN5_MARMO|nr:Hypothetical predicted protein [Marmota monax]
MGAGETELAGRGGDGRGIGGGGKAESLWSQESAPGTPDPRPPISTLSRDSGLAGKEEAILYHNQTAELRELLEFTRMYLQSDDEMELEETEVTPEPKEPPSDAEFEGEGDYEEGLYADWWQEPDAKGDEAEAGQCWVLVERMVLVLQVGRWASRGPSSSPLLPQPGQSPGEVPALTGVSARAGLCEWQRVILDMPPGGARTQASLKPWEDALSSPRRDVFS